VRQVLGETDQGRLHYGPMEAIGQLAVKPAPVPGRAVPDQDPPLLTGGSEPAGPMAVGHRKPLDLKGLHWDSGTLKKEHGRRLTAQVRELLEELSGGVLMPDYWVVKEGHRRHKWRRVWGGPAGTELWDNGPGLGMHLCLPGQVCELIGLENLIRLLAILDHATRLDVFIDDPSKVKTVRQLWRVFFKVTADDREMWRPDRAVVTKVKTGEHHGDGATGGKTIVVGATKSDRKLRIYDKTAESHGENDAVRYELQSNKGKAEALRVALLKAKTREEIYQVIGGVVRGFVDFRVVRGTEVERWSCAPWWRKLTGEAPPLRLVESKLPVSMRERRARQERWVGTNLPAIAAVLDRQGLSLGLVAHTQDGVVDLMPEVRARFRWHHVQIVQERRLEERVVGVSAQQLEESWRINRARRPKRAQGRSATRSAGRRRECKMSFQVGWGSRRLGAGCKEHELEECWPPAEHKRARADSEVAARKCVRCGVVRVIEWSPGLLDWELDAAFRRLEAVSDEVWSGDA